MNTRNRLIAACGASASAAMDAAEIEINRGSQEGEVEIFPGTRRGGETISTEGRDRRAQAIMHEVRQRLDELGGLYPCEGREPFPDLDLE